MYFHFRLENSKKAKEPTVTSVMKTPEVKQKTMTLPMRKSENLSKNQENRLVKSQSQNQRQSQNPTSGIDIWTTLLTENLNRMGLGHSHSLKPKTFQAALLPAMISESGGIVFNTQMVGVRNEKGKITIPQEFQLPMLNLAKTVLTKTPTPMKMLDASRVNEILDKNEEGQLDLEGELTNTRNTTNGLPPSMDMDLQMMNPTELNTRTQNTRAAHLC